MKLDHRYIACLRPLLPALLCAATLCFSQAAWAIAGTVQVLIGTARISQHSGQDRPALRGDNLYEGDTVATNANSNVQIRMIDDSIIWVRPDSRFKIERYQSNKHGAAKNEVALRLISGTMRQVTGAIGKGAPADYKLSTPNATIGIRGTEFDASYLSPQAAAQANTAPGTQIQSKTPGHIVPRTNSYRSQEKAATEMSGRQNGTYNLSADQTRNHIL